MIFSAISNLGQCPVQRMRLVQLASGGCDRLVGDGADSWPACNRGRRTEEAVVTSGGCDRPLIVASAGLVGPFGGYAHPAGVPLNCFRQRAPDYSLFSLVCSVFCRGKCFR
jgi:hypothetical protein